MNKYQEALDILHGFANGNLIRETTCDYQRDKNDEYKDILQELVDKATPKKPNRINAYWTEENGTYSLHFTAFYDEETILQFTKDPENEGFWNCTSNLISDEWTEAESPEESMQAFEELIEEHLNDQRCYYAHLQHAFTAVQE